MKDEKSQRILEEAEQLAFEVGYRRFNMDELSRRLRMSKKTVYESFSSKDELFASALNRRAAKILKRSQEILDLDESAMTKLYLMSKHVVDEVSYIKPALIKEVETFFPDVFVVFGRFYQKIVNALISIIDQGEKSGEFRSDVNPVVLAYMVQGIVELSSNPYFLIESGLSLEDVYTAFMSILMEGIITPSSRGTRGARQSDGNGENGISLKAAPGMP
jgi:TetR/AcrR family transcriptional regulator, cholesterol catabolism regulator